MEIIFQINTSNLIAYTKIYPIKEVSVFKHRN